MFFKNKKAETTVGDIIISVLLFSFIIMTAVTGVILAKQDNSLTVSEELTELNKSANNIYGNIEDDSTVLQNKSDEPIKDIANFGGFFLSQGIKGLSVITNTFGYIPNMISDIQGNTQSILPQEFWGVVIIICVIVVSVTFIGALYRFKFKK